MWEQILTYRISFIIWRLRSVTHILTLYFLWVAVLPQNTHFRVYGKEHILTYILGTSFIASLVASSQSNRLGAEINDGTISSYLLRPLNYFLYWFFLDLGDKSMNTVFALVEISTLILILHPPLFWQPDFRILLLAFIALLLAIILYFLFSLLLGFIGFWSPEVWGPRFIFSQLLVFFAGGLFPLDLLPKNIFTFLQFLPFTYLLFFPVKIYLGQLPYPQILFGLFVSSLWIILLYFLLQFIWQKGLKAYTAQGG